MTKRIVLFCAGGLSTILLVNKMRMAASAIGKDYSIDAYGLGQVDQFGPEADCILLGPHCTFEYIVFPKFTLYDRVQCTFHINTTRLSIVHFHAKHYTTECNVFF